MYNGVQLIAYADRFGGGDLSTLRSLLDTEFRGVLTGLHILPFYEYFDGADAGFDPTDHRIVDSRLGTWDDIGRLAEIYDLTADLIVNHVSDQSPQFLDFLAHGDDSRYAGMFLERQTVFPGGATPEELRAIYRPRPGEPFTDATMGDGSLRTMWTTFTPHQIDLNLRERSALAYIDEVLDRLGAAGISQIRLDAVGYAIKTRGTSCFMTDDTYRFIDELADSVSRRGMESLLEIHASHLDQIRIAERADSVYDFALPPLIIHALASGSASALRAWLTVSPRNVFTVLDTHDGIGIIDVGPDVNRPGLLAASEIDSLVDGIHRATNGESKIATGEAASNLDLYQVNTTFYSALGCDDDAYLLARLIQFFSPGIPQVYYAGLLAQPNDMELLSTTGVGRDINRPYLTPEQIASACHRPVVRHLLDLCRFRNTHSGFGGTFEMKDADDHELSMRWTNGASSAEVLIDLRQSSFSVREVKR